MTKVEVYAEFRQGERRLVEQPKWLLDFGDHNKLPSPILPTPLHPLEALHKMRIYGASMATSYYLPYRTRNVYKRDVNGIVVREPSAARPRWGLGEPVIDHVETCIPDFIPDGYFTGHCYWYHNYAILALETGNWTIDADKHIVYEPPIYYMVGCAHTNVEHKTPFNCYHEYKCIDCGHAWAVDSSG